MSIGIRSIIELAQARPDAFHVRVDRDQLSQIGAEAGETVIVSIRRATLEDWIIASSGRIYESAEAMDQAINELRTLPT